MRLNASEHGVFIRLRGRPPGTRITIRLDEDVIAWLRTQVECAGGGNYQSLINDALRQYIANAREPLEETSAASFGKKCAAPVSVRH